MEEQWQTWVNEPRTPGRTAYCLTMMIKLGQLCCGLAEVMTKQGDGRRWGDDSPAEYFSLIAVTLLFWHRR